MDLPIHYVLRSSLRRPVRSGLTVLSIAAVVAVYVVMGTVSSTMRELFAATGQPDEVLVMQAGAANAEFSAIGRDVLSRIATLEGIARDEAGDPRVSPELYLASRARLGGAERDVMLRGVTAKGAAGYRELGADRPPGPGAEQVWVGEQLARAHGLRVGDTVNVEGVDWEVGRVFSAQRTVYEQELWFDLDALLAATHRGAVSHLMVRVANPARAEDFVRDVNQMGELPIMAIGARQAFAAIGGMSLWMAGLGQFLAFVLGIGVVFAGMNTMYSATALRRREVGILRSMGFRRRTVIGCFMLEAALLGVAAGVIGALGGLGLSALPLDIPFLLASEITPGAPQLLRGVVLALVVALAGALLPSWGAARRPVVQALA